MKMVFSKKHLLTCAMLLPLIAAGETALFVLHLPTWPVFLPMVCFFLTGEDIKKAPLILVGGLAGIASFWLLSQVWKPLVRTLVFGEEFLFAGQIIYVLLFVGSIVVLGKTAPLVFNSFAFLYFLVAALAGKSDTVAGTFLDGLPLPLAWMILLVAGGGPMIAGCIAMTKALAKACDDPKQKNSITNKAVQQENTR